VECGILSEVDISCVAANADVNSHSSNLFLLALTTQKVLLKVIYDNKLYGTRSIFADHHSVRIVLFSHLLVLACDMLCLRPFP
jgi:hypothetical protein